METVSSKYDLYLLGATLCCLFTEHNGITAAQYYTYKEALTRPASWEGRLARHALAGDGGSVVGRTTGIYSRSTVLVNVDITAPPMVTPAPRRWSYPGWKTDRTAVGVCAHETGHHVEAELQKNKVLVPAVHGPMWRKLIAAYPREHITSYEPVPSEAFAETMRLFILNPQLLLIRCPHRYDFLTSVCGLRPSERRNWWQVLDGNYHYVRAAHKWLGLPDARSTD